MNLEFILDAIQDYLAGRITRSELTCRIKNHRIAKSFIVEKYSSYVNLLVDHIEQKLSAFPEESYGDDELKHILDVLEGRQPIQYNIGFVV